MELLQQLKTQKKISNLNESNVRSFRKKVEAELKKASKEKREPTKVIVKYSSPTGRPFDVQRSCVINTSIANATARALIQRFPQAVGNIGLKSITWARCLFKRMGFVKDWKTSSKVKIPDAARKEIEFQFHHEINTYAEKFKIPPSLILNLDQTPLKYAPVSQETMEPRGSTAVTIERWNDERMIIDTFPIPFSGKFLPTQLIYGGKTTHSIPKVAFSKNFSLNANPSHYSNSMKFLKGIVIPWTTKDVN